MDTLRDVQLLREPLGRRAARRGRCGRDDAQRFWRDRPTFVTGATGPGRRLARAAAGRRRARTSSAWCATGCPQSELVRARPARHASGSCAATSATRRCSSASLGEYEIDTVIHLAAQTIVGDRQPQPGLDVRDEHRRHLGAARGVPAQPAGQADRRRVVGQGLRRPRAAAVRRGRRRSQGRHPYDVSKSCADLIAPGYAHDLRAAGGHHPLRQLLRRRRPELEPHRAGHDPLGRCAASARSSAPTARSSATTSTSRTARAAYMLLAEQLAARPDAARARRSTSRTRCQVTVLELVEQDPAR